MNNLILIPHLLQQSQQRRVWQQCVLWFPLLAELLETKCRFSRATHVLSVGSEGDAIRWDSPSKWLLGEPMITKVQITLTRSSRGKKRGSGNNLWAINTLWLWRSEERGLKKWNSIEWRWIKGALVVNNYTEKKSDIELHPPDPSCRYWCCHPVCRWFRNCSGA